MVQFISCRDAYVDIRIGVSDIVYDFHGAILVACSLLDHVIHKCPTFSCSDNIYEHEFEIMVDDEQSVCIRYETTRSVWKYTMTGLKVGRMLYNDLGLQCRFLECLAESSVEEKFKWILSEL